MKKRGKCFCCVYVYGEKGLTKSVGNGEEWIEGKAHHETGEMEIMLTDHIREVEEWGIGEAHGEAGGMQGKDDEGATAECYRKTQKAMYSVTKGMAMPETRATRLDERMAGIRP